MSFSIPPSKTRCDHPLPPECRAAYIKGRAELSDAPGRHKKPSDIETSWADPEPSQSIVALLFCSLLCEIDRSTHDRAQSRPLPSEPARART
jgi:hypothetical protein